MTIARVQGKGNTSAGTSVAVTLDSPSINGNLLVAIFGVDDSGGTITPPAGWTLATGATVASAREKIAIYYYENAPSQAGAITFSNSTGNFVSLIILEYSGCATLNSFDLAANATGSLNPGSTGTTGTITQEDEVCVGGIVVNTDLDNETWSNPTNSFSIAVQVDQGAGNITSCSLERIVSATGTYGSQADAITPGSYTYAGAIATFKGSSTRINKLAMFQGKLLKLPGLPVLLRPAVGV